MQVINNACRLSNKEIVQIRSKMGYFEMKAKLDLDKDTNIAYREVLHVFHYNGRKRDDALISH